MEKKRKFPQIDGTDYLTKLNDPSLNLAAAVLERALADLGPAPCLVGAENRKQVIDSARRWLMDDNSDYLFSFRAICELLELDYRLVREFGLAGTYEKPKTRWRRGYPPVQKVDLTVDRDTPHDQL